MMNSKTDPVFKLILSVGLVGSVITLWAISGNRDILALGGIVLIATCVHAIARLVK